jgi:hypothetical protein
MDDEWELDDNDIETEMDPFEFTGKEPCYQLLITRGPRPSDSFQNSLNVSDGFGRLQKSPPPETPLEQERREIIERAKEKEPSKSFCLFER